MTEVEQPPQNGIGLSTAEDDDNSKARPADIEQDMREMERRKRVEAIMGSKLFREELERIVDSARDGGASGILQQLSDIVGVPVTRVGSVFKTSNCMVPINDIRGVESMGYAKGEKILRCKLAATFRLLDLYGWTQGLGAQITARLKVDQEYFLVNPYGLLYHELTASSLNKVDMQGNIVEQGTTNFGVNKSHFVLHSVVHAARPDIRCAIYIGCSPVVAISSLKTGLLPLTKDACVLGEITTYTYTGNFDEEERLKLVRNLGPNSKVILLANHGALCCGETIEEAFYAACHIVQACETQLKLLPVGLDNLSLIPEESRKIIYDQSRRPPEDLAKKFAAVGVDETTKDDEAAAAAAAAVAAAKPVTGQAPKWRVGGAEFEALMRMLDNAGYRTGYIYRHPLIKSDPPKPKNDVELPPAVSSLGYLLEEEELFRQGIWKKGDLRKGGDRSRWLNSPNVYQKVEVLETGTPDPKKITKWVAEGSPTHSTPVRIEDPLQFVPAGTTTKEFKRLQQQIKDNRRADKISAGPQSHILEGVTWDEANRIKDATVSQTGDHVVLMGAASKGIIQRGFQHNATVYKAPYAKNPFDNVTDDELNEYKRTVERKKKSIHGEYTDTDFSESEALSSLQTSGAQQTKQTTTTTTAAVSQSEPETSEHQVLRIETQQAPVPSQAEVVLSDATLSFINGERSHTATNRKPPTGREQNQMTNVQVNLSKKQNEVIDINDEATSKNGGAAATIILQEKEPERRETPKCRRELIKSNDIEQQRALPTLHIIDETNSKEIVSVRAKITAAAATNVVDVSNDGNVVAVTTATKMLSSSPKRLYYQRQNVAITPDYDYISLNSNFYEEPQTDAAAALYCKPNLCSGVVQALQKPYAHDNLICNIPFTTMNQMQINKTNVDALLYCGGSTTPTTTTSTADSTPCQLLTNAATSNTDTTTTPSKPYRTLSHFGFNSPRQQPKAQHKHLPNEQNEKLKRYMPISRSISYEEMFATPRFEELCSSCFEKLLRLKPELVLQLQQPPNRQQLTAGQQQQSYTSSIQSGNAEYDDCNSETISAFMQQNVALDAVPEIDELDLHNDADQTLKNDTQDQTAAATETAAAAEVSSSTTNFISKIGRLNFSEESTNTNFIAGATSISSDISIHEKQSQSQSQLCEDASAAATSSDIAFVKVGSTVTAVTEIWNFGNWQERPENYNERDFLQPGTQPLTERHVLFELTERFNNLKKSSKVDKKEEKLMSRDERLQRKLEFQELWEDHINYFAGKEAAALEEQEEEQQSLEQKQQHDEEVFKTVSTIKINKEANTEMMEDVLTTIEKLENTNLKLQNLMLNKELPFEEEYATISTIKPIEEIIKTSTEMPNSEDAEINTVVEHNKKIETFDNLNATMPANIAANEQNRDEQQQHNIAQSTDIVTQFAVHKLIRQFEQSLNEAGQNLNTLTEIVAKLKQPSSSTAINVNLNGNKPLKLPLEFTEFNKEETTIPLYDINKRRWSLIKSLSKILPKKIQSIGDNAMEEDTSSNASCATFDMQEPTVLQKPSNTTVLLINKQKHESLDAIETQFMDNLSVKTVFDDETDAIATPHQQLSHYVTLQDISKAADDTCTYLSYKNSNSTTDSMENSLCEGLAYMDLRHVVVVDSSVAASDIEEEEAEINKSREFEVDDDDEMSQFSTLERKILHKIERNQLKEKEEIFDKIDHTIRNKLTPSKLELIVQQNTDETYQTQTFLRQLPVATTTAVSSTPKAKKEQQPHGFNFGNAFEKYYQQDEDEMLQSSSSNTETSLDESHNNTEPCMQYNTNIKKCQMRLSRSLTPPLRRRSLMKSTSREEGVVCKTYKTRGQQSGLVAQNRGKTPSSTTTTTMTTSSNTSHKKKFRNFILENIRSAGKPKTITTPRASVRELTGETSSNIISQTRNITTTKTTATTAKASAVFSFEAKVVSGSPRLWVTVPRTRPPTTQSAATTTTKTTVEYKNKRSMEITPTNAKRFRHSPPPPTTTTTKTSPPIEEKLKLDPCGSTSMELFMTRNAKNLIENNENVTGSKSCYTLTSCASVMQFGNVENLEEVPNVVKVNQNNNDAVSSDEVVTFETNEINAATAEDVKEVTFETKCSISNILMRVTDDKVQTDDAVTDDQTEDDDSDDDDDVGSEQSPPSSGHESKDYMQTTVLEAANMLTNDNKSATTEASDMEEEYNNDNDADDDTSSLDADENNNDADDERSLDFKTNDSHQESVAIFEQNDDNNNLNVNNYYVKLSTITEEHTSDMRTSDDDERNENKKTICKNVAAKDLSVPAEREVEKLLAENENIANDATNAFNDETDTNTLIINDNNLDIDDDVAVAKVSQATVIFKEKTEMECSSVQTVLQKQTTTTLINNTAASESAANLSEKNNNNTSLDSDSFYYTPENITANSLEQQLQKNTNECSSNEKYASNDATTTTIPQPINFEKQQKLMQEISMQIVSEQLLSSSSANEKQQIDSEESLNNNNNETTDVFLNIPYPFKPTDAVSSAGTMTSDITTENDDDMISSSSVASMSEGYLLHQTKSATGVDCIIEALGEEIEQITPRLNNYKRKIKHLDEQVKKCTQNMKVCIVEQDELMQQQKKLREDIVLNQFAEEIACKVNTFSLSETED